MFTQTLQQFGRAMHSPHEIERQVGLARREPRQHPLTLAPARVLVTIAPEADDARAPQLWFGPGNFRHEFHNNLAIFASLLIGDLRDKVFDAVFSWFGFQFSHESSPS